MNTFPDVYSGTVWFTDCSYKQTVITKLILVSPGNDLLFYEKKKKPVVITGFCDPSLFS